MLYQRYIEVRTDTYTLNTLEYLPTVRGREEREWVMEIEENK